MIDISIIIPTHNRLWSLPKCINSIYSENIELQIIVVDDGSDDGTWEWLQRQPQLTSIRQEKWGKPWAVNKAFAVAKGKYVKFLDADDWLVPGALEKQFRIAEAKNCDMIVSGYDIYQDEIYEKTINWTVCDDFIAQQLGECDSSHYSAFLFRKSFIYDIPHRTSFASADFASRDDRCFMLEVAVKEPYYEVYNGSGFCHRHHSNDRLQFKSNLRSAATNLQHWLIYKNILKQLKESGRLTQRRINAAINILWPLAHWTAITSIPDAVEILVWINTYKTNFRPPEKGILGFMFRKIGFVNTERFLRFRRSIIKMIS
jgi:glycosyltransferase involved in cell wall biosynthesis